MRRKMILLLGAIATGYCISLLGCDIVWNGRLSANNISCVYAQNQDVQYFYDSLGRVSAARYQDGTEIQYEYDANGNLLYCGEAKKQPQPEGGGTAGGSQSGSGQAGNNPSGGNQTGDGQNNGNGAGGVSVGQNPVPEPPVASGSLQYTSEDIANYNQFKKRKPVIKSLKSNTSKKKYYLKIKIKQITQGGDYVEDGYQIKYATNSQFKKAKTVKVDRNKKNSITSQEWKVKKGKTYYVKVRASMRTKTGKTIYSKYSNTKKLKIE